MRPSVLVLVSAAGGCGACSPGQAALDAGGDAAGMDAAPDARDSAAWEAAPCQRPPRPSYVPAGWVPYDDYAPCSGLYIPADPSQLPPAVQWQDCEPAAGVAGCKRIQIDWPAPLPLGTNADAARDLAGNVVILTSREYADGQGNLAYNYSLVADSSGQVLWAMLATLPSLYGPHVYLPPTFQPPRFLWRVLENQGFLSGGYIAGTIGQLKPTAHGRYQGGAPWYGVGDLGVLQNNTLLDFGTGAVIQNIKGTLPMSFDWMFRGYVFWQGNSGRLNDVGRWDPDGGAIDFINYGFDVNHAAGDLGTDGTDMVWLEGHGLPSDTAFYTTADWWTSPYVTDPSQLKPRRLRSEVPNAILGVPITVGCGTAAYENGYGIRIVRLSDGWSWFLPDVTGWGWQQALALSCTELFASVAISGPIYTMARIPLASLGAGVPPD